MTTQTGSCGLFDNSGDEPPSNHSTNPHLRDLISRRTLLQGTLGVALMNFIGSSAHAAEPAPVKPGLMTFQSIDISRADSVRVPPGYSATPFIPWGTPLHKGVPDFRADASNSAADQEQQVGSHHDGMHFFPLNANNSNEGLLVLNHEYVDPDLLHAKGPSYAARRPAEEVRKEMAAHGVSVVHIRQEKNGAWQVVIDSRYNRRITASTPMDIHGPARGAAKMRTLHSPDGTRARGTFNNCAHGVTPWNTYLAAEENWAGYFANRDKERPREHARYGVVSGSRYGWESAQPEADIYRRFDASSSAATATADYRHEPNQFGWVVEINPFDPLSTPQKHTALGRFAREGVVFAPVREGQPLVCYSGDDSKNEYLYKYVSAEPYAAKSAGGHLLDNGFLFVARFHADGSGEWLPLDVKDTELQKKAKLAGVQFADQADVLINTRLAADVVGATKMDRPEWGAVDPRSGQVYFTLSNNADRTTTEVDAANPRAANIYGHIIRWVPLKGNHAERKFSWDIFVMGGPAGDKPVGGAVALAPSNHFACPDGLWFDPRGLLWIQTDMSGGILNRGPFGNNQMLAADTETGEIRRFLTGPVGCEITGVVLTPDLRTMFVNIQHPGEGSSPGQFISHWPDGGDRRPRSATVVIRKDDGGVIGS
ncbi:MAG: PhoX family phosphatase [Cellvibrionaceae bacterium]|nr:PhoX family phosphatase [Cellvibrionaceae bacterium]